MIYGLDFKYHNVTIKYHIVTIKLSSFAAYDITYHNIVFFSFGWMGWLMSVDKYNIFDDVTRAIQVGELLVHDFHIRILRNKR